MRILVSLLLVPLLLSGCGYRPPGKGDALPQDVTRLYIALLENRTAEPFLENRLTNDIVLRFSRQRQLQLVEDRASADAVLSGAVSSYSTTSVSYDSKDDIVDYRSRMSLEATLRRTDNDKVLWKGELSWSDEYSAAGGDKARQEANEARIILVLSERLAENLLFRIMEDF